MEYNSNTDKFRKLYYPRLLKRTQGKAFPVRVIMERTFSSAIWILDLVDNMPFEKLTMGVYFMCNDVGFKEIVRLYDAQLELAGANPDKFVFSLHSFYNGISARLKKENRLQELAEFLGTVMRVRLEKKGTIDERILDAYSNLILQTLEYLRPNKLDLEICVYGVSTDGEILTGPYPYAFSDIPSMNYQMEVERGRKFNSKQELLNYLSAEYKKIGIEMSSMDDLGILEQAQRAHINTTTSLLPFINEYTFDIVPEAPYSSQLAPLNWMTVSFPDTDALKEKLRHRRRTLPSNGVKFVFTDPSGELKQILIKEIFHFDSVHFLYRLDTRSGGLAGYYNTDTGFLYSIVSEATGMAPYQSLTSLLLVLYASQVLDGDYLSQFDTWFSQGELPLLVEAFSSAGKLRDVYHAGDEIHRKLGDRDPDKYSLKEAAINGYIRRLPAGQSASEEARALASQYGYDLNLNETYVRPFVKQVFVRKGE